jgi:DNA modification methylase
MMAKQSGRCAPSCEYVLIYSKGSLKTFHYEWLKTDKTIYEERVRTDSSKPSQMRDIWMINSTQGSFTGEERHPSQKPKRLLERIIKGYSNEGDTLLDACFGGGGFLLTALENNRNVIGIEKEPKYYKIGKRITQRIING